MRFPPAGAGRTPRTTSSASAWATCFREAGLGIADLPGFVAILRAEHPPQARVAFLRQRRAALEQQVAALHRAMEVLDEKITYYS
ncbi:hypothetical protein SHIRM173S_01620 [Streptomyces hirsutus]